METNNYQEYLQSEDWRDKRRLAIQRAGGRCQLCNALGPLEVHHRTYDTIPYEKPNDLTVLCRRCHEIVSYEILGHGRSQWKKELLTRLSIRRNDGKWPKRRKYYSTPKVSRKKKVFSRENEAPVEAVKVA